MILLNIKSYLNKIILKEQAQLGVPHATLGDTSWGQLRQSISVDGQRHIIALGGRGHRTWKCNKMFLFRIQDKAECGKGTGLHWGGHHIGNMYAGDGWTPHILSSKIVGFHPAWKWEKNHPMVPLLDPLQRKNKNCLSLARMISTSRQSFFASLTTVELRSGLNSYLQAGIWFGSVAPSPIITLPQCPLA